MKVWTPHQASQSGRMAKGLGIPRESGSEGQQDLIKDFHRTEGKRDFTFVVLSSQSWSTLCDPLYYSLPGSSVHGILQVRILEWVAILFSSHFLLPVIFPTLGLLQADSLLSELPGKPSTLVGHKQILVYARTQEKGAVSPQDTELGLPISVGGSPLEEWAGSGSSWDTGAGSSSTGRHSLAWALLEVTKTLS